LRVEVRTKFLKKFKLPEIDLGQIDRAIIGRFGGIVAYVGLE